ncbi:MAG: peptide chain release factor-like protein [bacterium]
MSFYNIRPEKEKSLREKMKNLNIQKTDIIEKFIRSSGKGGQHVNKSSTCVYLKHVPSGIEVKMQQERSQSLNRFLARRLLVRKIAEKIYSIKTEEQRRAAKIRRQKRRRSRRSKEKMLRDKKIISAKKKLRRPIISIDE